MKHQKIGKIIENSEICLNSNRRDYKPGTL